MYLLCEALLPKKIGFGRILDLPGKPNFLLLFFTMIITYWKPETSQLVHTPWDHEPLSGSIIGTS